MSARMDNVKELPRMPGILVLEDPGDAEGYRVFEGSLLGSEELFTSARSAGEVVFNTSLTGYQEILTDPSYFGQIVCMTAPHIGNTGVTEEDSESRRVWVSGFVVNQLEDLPSSWRAQSSLPAYLLREGVPTLLGVETRALTRFLRSSGVTRGIILPASERKHLKRHLSELPNYDGRDLIQEVTTPEAYRWPSINALKTKAPDWLGLPARAGARNDSRMPHVVAMDFGVKWNLLRALEALGCEITVVPARTPADEILTMNPDGIFLSNGPGDPSAVPYARDTVRTLLGKKPIFGVCMGHQLLGLAVGGKAVKLRFGHRGGNQPVADLATGRVEISSHNHGYAIEEKSLPPGVCVSHRNLNDQTVEGLEIPPGVMGPAGAFSVQYHPEACPGPHDSRILFERFVQSLR